MYTFVKQVFHLLFPVGFQLPSRYINALFMKKRILTLCFRGIAVASLAMLANCTSQPEPVVKDKADYVPDNLPPDALCLVKPSWFPHSQTPAPAEGTGSPFDVSETTNEIFHQWSWNKFLWLTKPNAAGTPLFLDPAQAKQVTTYMDVVQIPAGVQVVLQDFNQAGSTSPILRTNPGYSDKGISETVFYSIHMDPKMYGAGVDFGTQLVTGKLPATNEAVFPVGSFELKVAWVPITAIPVAKQAAYYITTASLSRDGGKTFANQKVALIGMHVVGVVENHPEFIWATFEHDDLSPDYDWTANAVSSTVDQLLFKKGSGSGIDGIRFNTATQLGYTPYQVFDLFKYGVPRDNTGAFMTTSQSGQVNFDNVDGINTCVKAKLDDVWKNYFYNGSIWLNTDGTTPQQQAQLINNLGPNIGSATPGSSARGSLNCANVTMESFTQTFTSTITDINVNNLANCFSCHRATKFGDSKTVSPLYLSHTFQDYLLRRNGTSVPKIENLKTKDEDRVRMMLK